MPPTSSPQQNVVPPSPSQDLSATPQTSRVATASTLPPSQPESADEPVVPPGYRTSLPWPVPRPVTPTSATRVAATPTAAPATAAAQSLPAREGQPAPASSVVIPGSPPMPDSVPNTPPTQGPPQRSSLAQPLSPYGPSAQESVPHQPGPDGTPWGSNQRVLSRFAYPPDHAARVNPPALPPPPPPPPPKPLPQPLVRPLHQAVESPSGSISPLVAPPPPPPPPSAPAPLGHPPKRHAQLPKLDPLQAMAFGVRPPTMPPPSGVFGGGAVVCLLCEARRFRVWSDRLLRCPFRGGAPTRTTRLLPQPPLQKQIKAGRSALATTASTLRFLHQRMQSASCSARMTQLLVAR